MRLPAATLAFVALLGSTVAAGQQGQGVARGQVADSSGGVLPGVTVVAIAMDGRTLKTAVTDRAGAYELTALPVGAIMLTFQLKGYASGTIQLDVQPGTEPRVVERLELAPLSETVAVPEPAPVVQPPRSAPRPPPARSALPALPARAALPAVPAPSALPAPSPPPLVRPVPGHDRDSVCGPAKPAAMQGSLGTIRSGVHKTREGLYLPGAELVINGGRREGLEVGRTVVVRREYLVRGLGDTHAIGEHSAGLVQIVAADEHSSVAVVVYSCGELRAGDSLAAFKPEPVLKPDPRGVPAYDDAARILFADEGQTLGTPGHLMVIDRGTDRGTRIGQRFTLFRQTRRASKPEIVGDAIVVAVRDDSATIRVDSATDAISAGDWAAPHTAARAARPRR